MTTSWADRAACSGRTALFFPEEYTNLTVAAARNICAGCPVSRPCLEEVLLVPQRDDRDGIFAGTTPSQRRAIRHTTDRHDRITVAAAH